MADQHLDPTTKNGLKASAALIAALGLACGVFGIASEASIGTTAFFLAVNIALSLLLWIGRRGFAGVALIVTLSSLIWGLQALIAPAISLGAVFVTGLAALASGSLFIFLWRL
ncbi:MAG: hypothetical protein AAGF88_11960 [Pseudomonadota bacterium]